MTRTGRRRGSSLLDWIEVSLVTLGTLCIGWYVGAGAAAAHEQAALARELDASRLALGGALANPSSPAAGLPVRSLVGRLEVPRVRLSAIAREGVDTRTLGVAVGHVPGTPLPGDWGNAAFAGHRDTFFRSLRRVRRGDEIVVTTPRATYRYLVTDTRVVNPEDVSVLDPTSRPTLTLVTCYPFDFIGSAPYRFVVRAAFQQTPR